MKSADVTLTLIYPFCMLTQQREERLGNTLPACVGVFQHTSRKLHIKKTYTSKVFLFLWILFILDNRYISIIKYKKSRNNWKVHTVSYSKHHVVLVSYIFSGNVLNEILCFHCTFRYNFSYLFIFILYVLY